jgi:hypothetical protein
MQSAAARQLIDQPFEVLIVGDNHDSSVQSPALFNRFTSEYYKEIAGGCTSAANTWPCIVDGEMKGLLGRRDDCGVDASMRRHRHRCFPSPRTSPCRGRRPMILSGGIPASVFGAIASDSEFIDAVKMARNPDDLAAAVAGSW